MDNPFGKVMTIEQAMDFFYNGMSLMFGGFGGVGSPPTIIDGIIKKDLRELTLIGNDSGFPEIGIGKIDQQETGQKINCLSYWFKSNCRQTDE